jgi:hypothetical protein
MTSLLIPSAKNFVILSPCCLSPGRRASTISLADNLSLSAFFTSHGSPVTSH